MKKRILILDDDEDILYILNEVMDYAGYETLLVAITDDLFGLIRKFKPTLILLDFALHGIDGGTWCTELKKNPEFAHIPVIIFTAYSNKGIEKGTYGCDDFIEKPFELTDLMNRIDLLTSQVV
jgi:DNA-binding response OmpR family regulator